MFLVVNKESLVLMLKYTGVLMTILMLVFVITLLTPWMAKKIDKIRYKPERVKDDTENNEIKNVETEYDAESFEVIGLYDAQIENKAEDAENK